MNADEPTLAFYDAEAPAYAAKSRMAWLLADFFADLPRGARVLDLGCGAGADSAALRAAGFQVTPVDASVGLAAEAKSRWNVDVCAMRFDQLDFVEVFDGVWASASLHHARAEDLPGIFAAIRRAVKTGGVFHATLKLGEDRRDVRIERNEGIGYDGELTPWLRLRALR